MPTIIIRTGDYDVLVTSKKSNRPLAEIKHFVDIFMARRAIPMIAFHGV